LGKVVSRPDSVRSERAPALRYASDQPHYRTLIEYSDEALHEAAQGYRRIEQFLRRVAAHGEVVPGELPAEFVDAMNDDLATPKAFAVMHNVVREGNTTFDAGDDDKARQAASAVRAMTAVLGIDP